MDSLSLLLRVADSKKYAVKIINIKRFGKNLGKSYRASLPTLQSVKMSLK